MDFSAIMANIKRSKEEGYTSMYNQREMLNSGVAELNRHQQVKDGAFLWVVPMQIQFAFNPFDPTDTFFDKDNPLVIPGTPSAFIKELKRKMQQDSELHARIADLGKMTPDEYNISNADDITEQDMEIFMKLRMPAALSLDTMKVRTPGAGQYGQEKLSPLHKDKEGKIIEEDYDKYAYQFLMFEQAIRREKFAEFKLSTQGQKTLSTDQKETLANIKKSAAMTYPKKSGVLMVYEFEVDGEDEKLKPIDPKKVKLEDTLTYCNCGSDMLKKLAKRIGKNDDDFLDYMLLLVTYGDGADDLELYKSREYKLVSSDDDYMRIRDKVIARVGKKKIDMSDPSTYTELEPYYKNFDELIMPMLEEGLSGGYEKAVKSAVYKYHNFSDAELVGYWKERMVEVQPYICDKIWAEFSKLIQVSNIDVYKELAALDKAGKLPFSKTEVQNAQFEEEDLKALDVADEKEANKLDKYDTGDSGTQPNSNSDEGDDLDQLVDGEGDDLEDVE